MLPHFQCMSAMQYLEKESSVECDERYLCKVFGDVILDNVFSMMVTAMNVCCDVVGDARFSLWHLYTNHNMARRRKFCHIADVF